MMIKVKTCLAGLFLFLAMSSCTSTSSPSSSTTGTVDQAACAQLAQCLIDNVPEKQAIYQSNLDRINAGMEPDLLRITCITLNSAAVDVPACPGIF